MMTERKKSKPRIDPVVPRLWHGPSTPVPAGFRISATDLARYGIDPNRVAKFETVRIRGGGCIVIRQSAA